MFICLLFVFFCLTITDKHDIIKTEGKPQSGTPKDFCEVIAYYLEVSGRLLHRYRKQIHEQKYYAYADHY